MINDFTARFTLEREGRGRGVANGSSQGFSDLRFEIFEATKMKLSVPVVQL